MTQYHIKEVAKASCWAWLTLIFVGALVVGVSARPFSEVDLVLTIVLILYALAGFTYSKRSTICAGHFTVWRLGGYVLVTGSYAYELVAMDAHYSGATKLSSILLGGWFFLALVCFLHYKKVLRTTFLSKNNLANSYFFEVQFDFKHIALFASGNSVGSARIGSLLAVLAVPVIGFYPDHLFLFLLFLVLLAFIPLLILLLYEVICIYVAGSWGKIAR